MEINALALYICGGLSSLFTVLPLSRSAKKFNLYTRSGARDFYELPAEIQQHITSLFIRLIKPELKYLRFQDSLSDNSVFVSNYCQKLDRSESKIAYDEDCPDDRYVHSIFVAEKTPHYYLYLQRSGIGRLKILKCKQEELALVTFKNNSITAFYKRNDSGYDLQVWHLSMERILDTSDCLALALMYHSFDSPQKDSIPLSFLCRKKIYSA